MSAFDDGRFCRTQQLIGADGMERLRRSFVIVIGVGAVGSYAIEGLVRAGIGRIRLVDFDQVNLSNINRQLMALDDTIGHPKVEAAQRRVAAINPDCQVEIMNTFAHVDTFDTILADQPDIVIDAIDSVSPKVALLVTLCQRQIPVISSMGAGLRYDPSYIRVGSLARASHCPLARAIRKRMRQQGVTPDITCVYSKEPTDKLPPSAIADYEIRENDLAQRKGRLRRPVGSLPTITGIFGLTAANTAIRFLLDTPPTSND